MNEERATQMEANEEKLYQPRPLWQVWAARVGLVLFVIFVICQFLMMMRGGL